MACVVALNGYTNQIIPGASYVKCIDIWSMACLIMILLALVVSTDFISNTTSFDDKRFDKKMLWKKT